MDKLLIIGAGGFVGAIARYWLSGAVHRMHDGVLPMGTLVVNLLGCLVIGAAMTLLEDRPLMSPNARLFLTIGFLGSFTTFSTFGYETVELLKDGELRWALLNIAGNVVLGLAAVLAGRAAVRAVGI